MKLIHVNNEVYDSQQVTEHEYSWQLASAELEKCLFLEGFYLNISTFLVRGIKWQALVNAYANIWKRISIRKVD